VVQGWLREAANPVEVLPPVEANRKSALVATQVTTRSPMGAIIYETGGILVDHGWIRILGSGCEPSEKTSVATEDGKWENDRFPFPGLFPKVSAMATRLIFLAVVCVGSVAFGQGVSTPPVATPAWPSTVATPAPVAMAGPASVATPSTVATPASVATPAKTSSTYNGYVVPPGTPVPIPPTPITPPAMLSGLVPNASPMGFTMHFHMSGSFDAAFAMNVTQGQAKEKASVAKKRKTDAAKKPQSFLQPVPQGTAPSGSAVPPSSYGSYGDRPASPR